MTQTTVEEKRKMGLDVYIEADGALTMPALKKALLVAGASDVAMDDHMLQAVFVSGLTARTLQGLFDARIRAEDAKGLTFDVASRCLLRIKGPEPEGHSQLEDVDRVALAIAQVCPSLFVMSFQFESTLFWRDETGLHRVEEENA